VPVVCVAVDAGRIIGHDGRRRYALAFAPQAVAIAAGLAAGAVSRPVNGPRLSRKAAVTSTGRSAYTVARAPSFSLGVCVSRSSKRAAGAANAPLPSGSRPQTSSEQRPDGRGA
jgi:hypothetical protein